MINQIKELQTFLNENIFEPAINANLGKDHTKSLKTIRTRINHFKRVGDFYKYFTSVLKRGDEEEMKLYQSLKSNQLTTFEDIKDELVEQFGDQLFYTTELSDIVEGQKYSKVEICALANNFNLRAGMRSIKFGESFEGFIAEIEIRGNKYPNQWIKPQEVIKYYPMTIKGIGLSKEAKDAINNKHLPFHIFIKKEENNEVYYLYSGNFKATDSNVEADQPYMILEKVEKVEKVGAACLKEVVQHEQFDSELDDARILSDVELMQKIKEWKSTPRERYTLSKRQNRNPYVVEFVLRRAKGVCERCETKGPFISKSRGTPFLEVHHIALLSEDGLDTHLNAIGLCPNCHREFHFGSVLEKEKVSLKLKVSKSK